MSDSNLPPSYPASSSPAPAAGGPVTPPQQVNIAFWLYIVGAALSLISLIVSLVTIQFAPQKNGPLKPGLGWC